MVDYRGGAVIRYSPNSGVVPYFSEILPLYLIDAHFPKNSQNPVPYRHPFSKMRIFADFPKMYLITAPFPKTSQSPVPYRRPLGVPYRHPLGVPYNALLKMLIS